MSRQCSITSLLRLMSGLLPKQVQGIAPHVVFVDDVVGQLRDDLVALALHLGLREHGVEVDRAHVARGHPARGERVVRRVGGRAVHVDDEPVVADGSVHERQAALVLVIGRLALGVALRRARAQAGQHDGAGLVAVGEMAFVGYDARPDTARERAGGAQQAGDGIGVEGVELAGVAVAGCAHGIEAGQRSIEVAPLVAGLHEFPGLVDPPPPEFFISNP